MTVAMAERFVLSPLKTKSLQRLIADVPLLKRQRVKTAGELERPFSETHTTASIRERLIKGLLAEQVKIDTYKR